MGDSRSPSPAGNATAEPKSDPHDRTPSLSPEPEVTTKQNRAVRGDSKHSSRDYEQSRFFESNRQPARGIQSRLQSRSPPPPREHDHLRGSSSSKDREGHLRPRSRDREHLRSRSREPSHSQRGYDPRDPRARENSRRSRSRG